jgi:hypothetical protein
MKMAIFERETTLKKTDSDLRLAQTQLAPGRQYLHEKGPAEQIAEIVGELGRMPPCLFV